MSEAFSIVVFLVVGIVSLLFAVGIVYFIVSVIRNKDEKKRFGINSQLLLNIYLYSISFITLLVAVIGGAFAIRSGLSYLFGYQFGYSVTAVNDYVVPTYYDDTSYKYDYPFQQCYVGESQYIDGTEYCVNTQQRSEDLVYGLTLFVSMALIFLAHQYGIRLLKHKSITLNRIYTFASLGIYGLTGIVVIPMAIYLTMNYLVISKALTEITPPAIAIGLAVLVLPLWILFLSRSLQEKD